MSLFSESAETPALRINNSRGRPEDALFAPFGPGAVGLGISGGIRRETARGGYQGYRFLLFFIGIWSAILEFSTSEFFPRGSSDKVSLYVVYPERVRWWLALIRVLFGEFYVGIPHGVCLFGRPVATGVLIFIAWWAGLGSPACCLKAVPYFTSIDRM